MNCDTLKQCSNPECTLCTGMELPQNFLSHPTVVGPVVGPLDKLERTSCNPMAKFHIFLTRSFYILGRLVADSPSYFIIIPIFITIIGITGFQRITFEEDVEALFYPRGGPAPGERAIIEHHFPMNYSSKFLPYHMTRISGFVRLLVKAKDDQTILRSSLWDEIIELDQAIQNITISENRRILDYSVLCAKYEGKCHENGILQLYPEIDLIENGTIVVNYPLMLFPLIVPMYFGGITVSEDESYIETAQAIHLNYFLNLDTIYDQERAAKWESEFLRIMTTLTFEEIHVSYFASRSMHDLIRENPQAIKPYIPLTVILMLIFSMCSVMMSDWVRSKIFLGAVGMLSALMGTGTAFGLLMYVGVPMSSINAIIPFLMVGIGVDDMFVGLAAFRRTRLQESNARRMGKTYAEAGVSITITSLTNMISFMIGATTPILAVRLFCIYTAVSILMTYVWHLTFFGGCLAIAGTMEKNQKHALVGVKIKAKSQTESRLVSAFWAGGINPSDPWNKKDNQDHMIMVFFRDYIGTMLTYKVVKGTVIFIFFVYLAGAMYGFTNISEGLDRRKLVRDDSYIVDYYDMEDQLFRKYPYLIQVVVSGNLSYSDPKTRQRILDLQAEIDQLPFIANKMYSRSWLRSCHRHLKKRPEIQARIHNESDFIREIKQTCLFGENAVNVEFNKDESSILASRFVIQTYEVNDTVADTNMMLTLRKMAQESSLNVTVFNPNFILFDQYVVVRGSVIQATVLAAVAMIAIALIFIPNPWSSLHVGFSIISIEFGVIGYMSLWNVSLDPISMVTLIMCIGFSVDFSAHVSYAYLTAKSKCPNDKIRECLFCLGLPIVQGGLSTIISICTFILVPSYAYVAFFKVIFLVVTFAVMHGLFLIPVLLSITAPVMSKKDSSVSDSSSVSVNTLDMATSSTTDESLPSTSPPSIKGQNKLAFYSSFEDLPKFNRADPEGCSYSEGFTTDEESKTAQVVEETSSSSSSSSSCSPSPSSSSPSSPSPSSPSSPSSSASATDEEEQQQGEEKTVVVIT